MMPEDIQWRGNRWIVPDAFREDGDGGLAPGGASRRLALRRLEQDPRKEEDSKNG